MCGIVGYIGKKDASPIILDGLRRMEYRGYDSAGIAVIHPDGSLHTVKRAGKIGNLLSATGDSDLSGTVGLGHTRWATHGAPTDQNAHPHLDCGGEIAVVHNGIIENYQSLRHYLEGLGHIFNSETDTEVIAHLIEEYLKEEPFEEAVLEALAEIKGTYGIVIINKNEPGKMIAARLGSPLILGVISSGEYVVASDAAAILPYTREVIYLDDLEIAVLGAGGMNIKTLRREIVHKKPQTIEWDISQAEKKGFPHFLLKEIFEGADAIRNSLRGRIVVDEGLVKLGGIEQMDEQLRKVKKVIIAACGTSYYSGLVGRYMMEEFGGVICQIEHASEYRYRKIILEDDTAILAISQSGETADTLAALREAKRRGVPTIGIVNVVGSSIASETDVGIYNHIGPEIGVASTKAFISQVAILALLATYFGRSRGMSQAEGMEILRAMEELPDLAEKILRSAPEIFALADRYTEFENFLYLGRKYNYPIALEGALKLKEISYAHAEGYPAGEMKHGPIALVEPAFPCIYICPQDSVYSKNVSNIQEIKAHHGCVLAIATEGDDYVPSICDDVIFIPKTLEMLTPILSVIPLQFFAYKIAVNRGTDVDQPRNLAKSVTVE